MNTLWFLGRWHVLALHLPIGIVLVTVLLECCAWSTKFRHLTRVAPLLWALAALSAVLTVALGLAHATEGGFDPTQLAAHRAWALTLTASICAAWLLLVYADGFYRRIQPVVALAMLVMLFGTGHYGGNLTHGSSYLIQYAPFVFGVRANGGAGTAPAEGAAATADGAASAAESATPMLSELLESGLLARLVALGDSHLVIGMNAPGRALNDAQLATLRLAAPYTVELDLREAGLDDAKLVFLSDFAELEVLRLAQNGVGDATVSRVARLPALRELNLYGNSNVTDASIDVLLEMSALDAVFLWQTSVTDNAIARLRAARPGLRIQGSTATTFMDAKDTQSNQD
jgi:uncharacterized membrane protein